LKTARDAEPGTSIGRGLKSFGPSLKKKQNKKTEKWQTSVLHLEDERSLVALCCGCVFDYFS